MKKSTKKHSKKKISTQKIILSILVALIAITFIGQWLVNEFRPDILEENMTMIEFPSDWKKNPRHSSTKSSGPSLDVRYYNLMHTYNVSEQKLAYKDLKTTIDEIMINAGFQNNSCSSKDGVCGSEGTEYSNLDAYYHKKTSNKCTLYAETSINPIWEYTQDHTEARQSSQSKPPQDVTFILKIDKDCYQ